MNGVDESRVDPSHGLVLSGVLIGIEVEDIEDAVQTVKALGRVRVRAEKYHSKLGSNLVLCESRLPVDPDHTPSEIIRPGGESPWKTILLTHSVSTPQTFSFQTSKVDEGRG